MKKVKLVDICKIQYGFAFDSSLFSNSNNGMPLIRIRDVVRGFTDTYTSESFIEDYVVNKGDLLIGMDGEFNIAEWQSEKALLNQRVCKLIPSSTVGKRYIYYSLIKILKQIEEKTAFVTVKHLSAKELNKVEILLPSLEEQKEIAEKLDKVSDLIEKRKQQLKKLDELVKSRFIEMFGELDLSAQKSDWERLSELGTIYTGTTPSTSDESNWEGDILWITPAEMNEESFFISDTVRKITEKGAKSKSLTQMPIGTVLLSTRAPIGKVGIVAKPMTCNQGFKNFYCPDKLNSIYLYVLLKHNTQYLNSIGTGTTFKEISKTTCGDIRIPVPAMDKQNEFAEFVKLIDKSKFEIQKSLEKLEILKKSLMQQYFG